MIEQTKAAIIFAIAAAAAWLVIKWTDKRPPRRGAVNLLIIGYGQYDSVAFERIVPDADVPHAIMLAGAPGLEHVKAFAWPMTEPDAASIVGALPSGLTYYLKEMPLGRAGARGATTP
jgi:hypothetical protein